MQKHLHKLLCANKLECMNTNINHLLEPCVLDLNLQYEKMMQR